MVPWADSTNKEAKTPLKGNANNGKQTKLQEVVKDMQGASLFWCTYGRKLWHLVVTWYHLKQTCPKSSPRAKSGPPTDLKWPVALLRKHDAISLISTAGRHRRAPSSPRQWSRSAAHPPSTIAHPRTRQQISAVLAHGSFKISCFGPQWKKFGHPWPKAFTYSCDVEGSLPSALHDHWQILFVTPFFNTRYTFYY